MTQKDKQSRYWFQRHPRLTLAAAAVLGCLTVVVAAETAARLFLPEWPPRGEERIKFWTYHEKLGWAHAPGTRGRFGHRDFSVEVSINSHGMRDDEYPLARNNKKRMLVLGDSFGWGFGVDVRHRFSELMETSRPEWEIINASVSGYGTDQQLIYLTEYGAAFEPDVVLLLFHHSDFRNNLNANEYWYNKPYFVLEDGGLRLKNTPVPRSGTRQKLKRFLLGRTYLGKIVYNRSGLLRDVFAESRRTPETTEALPARMEILEDSRQVTRAVVKAIDDFSKRRGARFVLVSIPMSDEEKDCLSKLAAEENFPFLPLGPFFESSGERATFPHDGHWNEMGHKTAAAAIEAFLLELGIF